MKKIRFLEIFITLIAFMWVWIGVVPVSALDDRNFVIDRGKWAADDNLLGFTESYAFPSKVIILPLEKKETSANSRQDIKELYYYFTTRSGIGDFPFHYLVCWDGNVYQGNKLGDEAGINLYEEGTILIAYVQEKGERLTMPSVEALRKLILDIANKYGIDPEKIDVRNLAYTVKEKGELKNVKTTSASKVWQDDVKIIKEAVQKDYSPKKIEFKAQLVDVTVPADTQKIGETVEIKVKVKNTSDFSFYSGTTSNLFVARDKPFDERSSFYLAEEWDSPSRVALLKDGERLIKGEKKEFTFKVFVPLFPPEKSENFVLVDPKGNVLAGSEFEVNLRIEKGDETVIEVTETEVGYLNVRSTAGIGEVITRVTPGERFIVLEYKDGYYKIEANGKEGWVVNTYVRVVD